MKLSPKEFKVGEKYYDADMADGRYVILGSQQNQKFDVLYYNSKEEFETSQYITSETLSLFYQKENPKV